MSYFRKLYLTVVCMNRLIYAKEFINNQDKVSEKLKRFMSVFKRNMNEIIYTSKEIV